VCSCDEEEEEGCTWDESLPLADNLESNLTLVRVPAGLLVENVYVITVLAAFCSRCCCCRLLSVLRACCLGILSAALQLAVVGIEGTLRAVHQRCPP